MNTPPLIQQKKWTLLSFVVGGLSVLLAVIIMGYWVISKMESGVKFQLKNQLTTAINTTEESIDHWAKHHLYMVSSLANKHGVLGLVKEQLNVFRDHDSLLSSTMHSELRNRFVPMVEQGNYIGYFIAAPDFTRISAYRPIKIGKKMPDIMHETLQHAFDGVTHITDPNIFGQYSQHWPKHMPRGIPSAFALAPIQDESGETIAVLALHLPSTKDWTHISSVARFGKSGDTYLVNNIGNLISESRFLVELKQRNILPPDASSSIGMRLEHRGETHNIGQNKPSLIHSVEEVVNKRSGFRLEPYEDYRGVQVVGAWHWDSERSIGIVSEIDADEAYAVFQLARWSHWASIGGTLVLVLSLISYSARRYLITVRVAEDERLGRHKEEVARKFATHLAMHDQLTGLPNRRLFIELGEYAITRAKRNELHLGVVFLDIDYFKKVNDEFGHDVGDEYLKQFSRRLLHIVRGSELLCRMGGDEFALIFEGVKNRDDMIPVAEKVYNFLSKPFQFDEQTGFESSCSIGISLYPEDGSTFEVLIKRADEAMYQVKKSGRANYKFYGE
ncbi:MAG: diguanylate cyclase [Sedimenticola sp.]